MKNDTRIQAAVAIGLSRCPDEHHHATTGSVGWCAESGIVSARTVLGVENNKVVARATLAVVIGLEVASGFVKAKPVQDVVVVVSSVEQLRDGEVNVFFRADGVGVEVLKLARRAVGTVVSLVIAATVRVDVCNSVVATSGGVVLGTISKPSVWRSINVPRVLEDQATALRRIGYIPGEDLHGGKLRDVVNDAMYVFAIVCVDICQEPILGNVSLNTPGQDKATVSLLEVYEARLWVANGTARLLQGVDLITSGLGGG